ncbi:hypothetical protein MTsPCn5_38030 [Croceitalea sp. MTPC5]|uniref:hypothetical protein n=1 Tax=Croceitalea sp. MTPC5 TaxID=3056565 RepID=UPI002B364264|nr:hypothetical protein MTsPCn5_38030 [Croceitalea sp. MTPC5]
MAKIITVEPDSVPEEIIVNDNIHDIIVKVKLDYHLIDLQLRMQYCLHLFMYDIHGEIDAPLVVPNWDESAIHPIALDSRDDFLGSATRKVIALKKRMEYNIPMALHLGKLKKGDTSISRKLEIFATLTPAVGRASKWSKPFESILLH